MVLRRARGDPHDAVRSVRRLDVGRFAADTHLEVAPRTAWRRRSELDAGLLDAVSRSATAGWDENTPLRPSPSLYRLRDRLCYLRGASGRAGRIVAVAARDDIVAVVAAAAGGAAAGELKRLLAERGLSDGSAHCLITSLVDRELLVPIGQLRATGDDALAEVVTGLRQRPRGAAVAERLQRACCLVQAMDADGIGLPATRYAEVDSLLASDDQPTERTHVVVDLLKRSPELRLGPGVLAELRRAADLVARLRRPDLDRLGTFRRGDFARRYGRREVRLVEALDPQTGVRFAPDEPEATWRRRDTRLLTMIQDAGPGGEVGTSDADVDGLAERDGWLCPPRSPCTRPSPPRMPRPWIGVTSSWS